MPLEVDIKIPSGKRDNAQNAINENVSYLRTWLHQEASLRSRGKRETESDRGRDPPFHDKSDWHSSDIRLTNN